jgi:glycosyltransferase involved in cell wall biosynthesis
MPKISIGLPCYNEARFIEETVRSLLVQTETDFELNICDNASTDGTLEIVQKLAHEDARIMVHPIEQNIGAVANYKRALELAKSPYMLWAGGHDLVAKDFLKKQRLLLDADPSCALVYVDSVFIAQDGSALPDEKVEVGLDLAQDKAAERYKTLIWRLHRCDMVCGMIRREMIDPATFVTFAPDMVFLADLSLRGRLRRVPELLFYRRRNRGVETAEMRQEHLKGAGFMAPTATQESAWRELRDAFVKLLRAPYLTTSEREVLRLATYQAFKERHGVAWDATEAANWYEKWQLRFAKREARTTVRRRIEQRIQCLAQLDDDIGLRAHLEREVANLLKENHRLRRQLVKLQK